MIKYIYCVLAIICFVCLGINNKHTDIDIVRIKVSYKSPEAIVQNRGVFFTSEFYISYYKEYCVYELPYHVTSEINNVLMYDSVKYEFFVCNNNNVGYLVKKVTDSLKKKISGDSIILARAFGGGKGNVFDFSYLITKSLSTIKNSTVIRDRYVYDNSFYDSGYLQYDEKLTNIKFSFSKILDSTHHSKLSKIQLFIKHNPDTVPPGIKDFYINSFEMEKVASSEEAALKNLLQRFIAAEKKERNN